jgi:hypothetical protein
MFTKIREIFLGDHIIIPLSAIVYHLHPSLILSLSLQLFHTRRGYIYAT